MGNSRCIDDDVNLEKNNGLRVWCLVRYAYYSVIIFPFNPRKERDKQLKRQARFHSTRIHTIISFSQLLSISLTPLPAPIQRPSHVLTSTQIHKLSATAVISGAHITNKVVSIRSYKVPVHSCAFSLENSSSFHPLFTLLFLTSRLQRKLAFCPPFPFAAEQ